MTDPMQLKPAQDKSSPILSVHEDIVACLLINRRFKRIKTKFKGIPRIIKIVNTTNLDVMVSDKDDKYLLVPAHCFRFDENLNWSFPETKLFIKYINVGNQIPSLKVDSEVKIILMKLKKETE